MPYAAKNPSHCPVCDKWLTNLWTHERRSKTHQDKLANIKAINFHRETISATTIKLTNDEPTRDEQ